MRPKAAMTFDFPAGGEMAALMRKRDWAASPLGLPDDWPASLQTLVRLLLSSMQPMLIWWGPELIQLYNDAYRETMAPEQHPKALGQRARECWPEAWDIVGPQINAVMSGQGPALYKEQFVPLTRHGIRQDTWWYYGFNPIEDDSKVAGVFIVAHEVTAERNSREELVRLNSILAEQVRKREQAQAELTVERRRLATVLEKTQRDLAQQVFDWQTLHEMGDQLLQSATLQDELAVILNTVASFHGVRQGLISLYDARAGGLVTAAGIGLSQQGLTQLACIAPGDGACGNALAERRRVIVEDTETDPIYAPYREFAAREGIRAVHSTPFFMASGEAMGVVSVYFPVPRRPSEREVQLTDICARHAALFVERKRAEESLLENTVRLKFTLDSAQIGDWDLDLVNDTAYRSLRHDQCFGYADGLPDWSFEQFIQHVHPQDRAGVEKKFHEALTEFKDWHFECRVIWPDQSEHWIAAHGCIYHVNRKPTRMLGIVFDITEWKCSVEAMRIADVRKDEFLAMLAHELRNPLAPISAAAQLLKLVQHDESRVHQVSDIIERQVDHMTNLVDDLLDVSRVTRGVVNLDKSVIDIKHIVSDAVEQVRPLIENRRHRLAVHHSAESALVQVDKKRLVQVVANLLNNAAKYTPEGGDITLRVEVDNGWVRLRVRDTGIGMAPELVARAFELFAQAQRTSDRSQGGLGVGLALVKSLVELHGGSVKALSKGGGAGSEFFVDLPRIIEPERLAEEREESTAKAPLPRTAQTLRIMIVDDNRDAAHTLAMFLEAMGHEVIVEHSSHSALERACTTQPDVFLLDIGLPDTDGNDLARRLRAAPETRNALLIAVTGYKQTPQQQNAMAAGFDHHFVKPVNTAKLMALFAAIGTSQD